MLYILNLDVENGEGGRVGIIEHHGGHPHPATEHEGEQLGGCGYHPGAGQSDCNVYGTQLVLDPLDIELEEKKVTDVLHRSKEQKYAFDRIYRNQPSDIVSAPSRRFTPRPCRA